jgi:hypothetical protein
MIHNRYTCIVDNVKGQLIWNKWKLNSRIMDILLRPEEAAIGNSTLPTVLDKLCANINTRKLIEIIKDEIKLKETKIEELAQMIDSLQQKIDDHNARLDILSSVSNQ